MGRYENTVKLVQLRSLIEEKKYKEAIEIAQELEVGKLKDISEFRTLADVYAKCGRYDKAKEFYSIICEEYRTRKNMYTLIMLCLKSGSYEEAESLYQEYLTLDKNSIYKYILRYRIDKSKGADRLVIIKDLQDIKREFYMEEWAYELAKQYHKAGMIKECMEECDDIILWFGQGEIVEKAKLLKMHYDANVEEDIMQSLQAGISSNISRYMDESSSDSSSDEDDYELDATTDIIAGVQLAAKKLNEDADHINAELDSETEAKYPEEHIEELPEETDSRKNLLRNALSVAAGLKDAMKSVKEAAEDVLPMESDVQDVQEEEIIQEEEQEQELTEDIMKAVSSGVAEVLDEVVQPEETVEESKEYQVSRHGSHFNYVSSEELCDMLDAGVDNRGHYAIALADSDNANQLVREITKRIKEQGVLKEPKIAKISAERLNGISLDNQIEGLLGACILIENASAMSPKTVNGIIKAIDSHPGEVVIILVDSEENLSRFLFKEEVLNNQIKYYAIL